MLSFMAAPRKIHDRVPRGNPERIVPLAREAARNYIGRPTVVRLRPSEATRLMRLGSAIILLLPVVAGCADASGEWHGTLADSAGVSIVENPATPASAELWEAHEVLRIGSAAGALETQFGLIASLAVADDGRVHVLDQQHRRIRIFDTDGTFVREIGSSGEGPGELSGYTIAVLVDPGDTIWVADLGNARFARYTPDGAPAGDVPMVVPGGAVPSRFAMLDDGRILEMARALPSPERPEQRDDLLLVLGRDGAVRDTLHRMNGGASIRFRGDVAVLSAYAPEPVWAVAPDGTLYTGRSDDYRIEVREAGRLVRVIERAHERQPVTGSDQRAFLRLLRRTLTDQGVDPMTVERMASGMSFAETYPVFAHFLPGPDGTLWVQQIRTAADVDEGTFDAANVGSDRWDVFDADGRFIATAHLPDRFTPLTVAGHRFYGLWRDELDVQHVLAVEVGPVE